jgi:sodium transport system ATP-binding protein
MIRTENLTKVYQSRKEGRVVAVDHLNLRCEAGQVYALLGANGAGKTTTLRVLSTLIEPTAGDAYVNEFSVRRDNAEIRRLIGVVSYETRVYERMTPREIAYFFGRLNDLSDATIKRNIDFIFDLLNMKEFADKRTDRFSSGMKQKTVIMRALVTNPEVLILDEPTAGLDLLTAKNVADYIRLLRDHGKTIIFSTHVLWEAEKLADTVGIIHRGSLIAEGSLAELQARSGRRDLEDIFFSHVGPQPAEPLQRETSEDRHG